MALEATSESRLYADFLPIGAQVGSGVSQVRAAFVTTPATVFGNDDDRGKVMHKTAQFPKGRYSVSVNRTIPESEWTHLGEY